MPDFGQARPSHIEKGGVWLKPFCTTEGKTFSPVRGGAPTSRNIKQLLLFTLTLPLRGAFGDNASSFFALWQRTKQENTPKGSALWIPVVRCRGLSIFPPRAKNVYQHFSSVAKMSFANLIFASGNPKIPLLLRFGGCPPSVWQKVFEPYSPLFRYARGVFAPSQA